MKDILDLDHYPLDREGSPEWHRLVEQSIEALRAEGMFNLEGFLRPGVAEQAVREIKPVMDTQSHVHKRMHNIYFKPDIPELAPDHPALRKVETISHTVCADQISEQPAACHLRIRTTRALPGGDDGQGKTASSCSDPLARTNVMAYRAGEALNWHFDRSEFTTTLLLQEGGARAATSSTAPISARMTNPNYEGVARVLEGRDPDARTCA